MFASYSIKFHFVIITHYRDVLDQAVVQICCCSVNLQTFNTTYVCLNCKTLSRRDTGRIGYVIVGWFSSFINFNSSTDLIDIATCIGHILYVTLTMNRTTNERVEDLSEHGSEWKVKRTREKMGTQSGLEKESGESRRMIRVDKNIRSVWESFCQKESRARRTRFIHAYLSSDHFFFIIKIVLLSLCTVIFFLVAFPLVLLLFFCTLPASVP